MSIDFLTTILAGIATMLGAVLTQFLVKKQIKQKELDVEETGKIVEAVKSQEAARRASSLEYVLQKLPDRPDSSSQILQTLDEVVKRLPIPQASAADSPAVESLIRGYHEQALSQASAQFWFSVVAATVGFGWILYAGMDIKPESFLTVMKTFPGVVMDAVAFLFFKQASETRQRATELYDRLRKDKQMSESISLVNSIADAKVKSTVQAQIALSMAGLNPTPIDLSKFLGNDPQPPKN